MNKSQIDESDQYTCEYGDSRTGIDPMSPSFLNIHVESRGSSFTLVTKKSYTLVLFQVMYLVAVRIATVFGIQG